MSVGVIRYSETSAPLVGEDAIVEAAIAEYGGVVFEEVIDDCPTRGSPAPSSGAFVAVPQLTNPSNDAASNSGLIKLNLCDMS